eukprot:426175-Rhodomonas_salina.1
MGHEALVVVTVPQPLLGARVPEAERREGHRRVLEAPRAAPYLEPLPHGGRSDHVAEVAGVVHEEAEQLPREDVVGPFQGQPRLNVVREGVEEAVPAEEGLFPRLPGHHEQVEEGAQ